MGKKKSVERGTVVRLSEDRDLGFVRADRGIRQGLIYSFPLEKAIKKIPSLELDAKVGFSVDELEMLDSLFPDPKSDRNRIRFGTPKSSPKDWLAGDAGAPPPPVQKFLDPRDRTGATKRDTGLPPELHSKIDKLTHVPDTSNWQPGDLLLFSPIKSNGVIRFLQKRKVNHDDHARWTHAAIYVGHCHICEVQPRTPVLYRSLLSYVGGANHLIRVRRYVDCSAGRRPLSLDDGYRLSVKALSAMAWPYRYWQWGAALQPKDKPASAEKKRFAERYLQAEQMFHCAELYCGAFADAMHKRIDGEHPAHMLPARLSASHSFDDVDVKGWITL